MGEEIGATLKRPPGPAEWSVAWDCVQHAVATRRQAGTIEEFYRQGVFRDAGAFLANPG